MSLSEPRTAAPFLARPPGNARYRRDRNIEGMRSSPGIVYTETDMNRNEMKKYSEIYRDGLLEQVLPFWLDHGVDARYGGVYTCLDRDGSLLDTDKSVWAQGRFAWLLSTLYSTLESRDEWLRVASRVVEFIRSYCIDEDGRCFFSVTADGRPIRKRRYLFSEAFAAAGLGAYGHVASDDRARDEAMTLFRLLVDFYTTPGSTEPKEYSETRASRSIAMPMIIMNVGRILYDAGGDEFCMEWIDRAIEEIRTLHVKRGPFRVLETVGPDGEFLDHFDGRRIAPGHIMEVGWFILDESLKRGGDDELTGLACEIIDWSWKLGWDEEYGGIIYYRDAEGLPCTEYSHDMKFWWPQCEAIVANLLGFVVTGREVYAERHRKIHEWTYERYPDPEYGEWYGYLHRDGRLSTRLKGNIWKGPFHIPRMQWFCHTLLEREL